MRLVLRFENGKTHSFDVDEGKDPVAVVRKHLALYEGLAPKSLEEQVYDPSLPTRFRYLDRSDLLKRALEEDKKDQEFPGGH